MKVTMHYIEELTGSADWRWTHVPQGGLMPSRGPEPDGHGQITLNGNQYTANSRFNHKTISPRPSWALGLVGMGIMGLFGASATAQYPVGAVTFALFGILAIIAGIMNYSKSFHIYALFSEGTALQVPFVRDWIDARRIDDALQFTTDAMAMDAKAQLGREILNPNVPWAMVIMAAIAGLGGGALLGVIVANVR